MLYLSELYIELLAWWNNAHPVYHHINNKGTWEFLLKDDFNIVIYKSKGLQ